MPETVSLVIDNCQCTMQVREFRGQRVVTFRDVDRVHERPEGTAARNFSGNKRHFVEGVDFFRLTPADANSTQNVDLNSPNGLTVLTESGYLMIVKTMTDDRAWEVQRALVAGYFRAKETLAPKSPAEMMLMMAQQMVDQERRMNELVARQDEQAEQLAQIQATRDEAEQAFKDLPMPDENVPDLTVRVQLNRLVRAYCRETGVAFSDAWNRVYTEFRDRFHVDLKARAHGKVTPLDVAEQLSKIRTLYAVAHLLYAKQVSA